MESDDGGGRVNFNTETTLNTSLTAPHYTTSNIKTTIKCK